MRLGMFGGAFDPPHLAHVALARAAVDQLALDELRVFPTGQAWHKQHALADAAHRLAMAGIAFAGLPRTVVDDRETRRQGPTYTVDTLRELRAAHPDAQLFLVMGEDQALAIATWREWQAVLEMATICVAHRGHAGDAPGIALPPPGCLRLIRLPDMPESATEVRELLADGRDIAHLVPEGVARYIDRHSLYRTA